MNDPLWGCFLILGALICAIMVLALCWVGAGVVFGPDKMGIGIVIGIIVIVILWIKS